MALPWRAMSCGCLPITKVIGSVDIMRSSVDRTLVSVFAVDLHSGITTRSRPSQIGGGVSHLYSAWSRLYIVTTPLALWSPNNSRERGLPVGGVCATDLRRKSSICWTMVPVVSLKRFLCRSSAVVTNAACNGLGSGMSTNVSSSVNSMHEAVARGHTTPPRLCCGAYA